MSNQRPSAQTPIACLGAVLGARVPLTCNVCELHHALSPAAVDALWPQVSQHNVVVGAAWGAGEQQRRCRRGRSRCVYQLYACAEPHQTLAADADCTQP